MRYEPDDLDDALPPPPIGRARDNIAERLEALFPGWAISHDLFGWRAVRARDSEIVRAQSSPALSALLPFYDD